MIIIKSKEEINIMREGGKILSCVLERLKQIIKPGVFTREINEFVENNLKDLKAKPAWLGYRGYPASICTSVNDEVVHGIPGKKILKEGDIISLDLGLLYKGYYVDAALTLPVGKIKAKAKRLIDVTKEAFYKGMEQAKTGNRIGDISFAIQEYVEKNGFSVVRELVGHGIGKEIHEDPQIPNFGERGTGVELKEGMTLAIEPMVNMGGKEVIIDDDKWTVRTKDGSLSSHFEHTILINSDGPEILTKV